MPIDIPYNVNHLPAQERYDYAERVFLKKCKSRVEAENIPKKYGGMIITDVDGKTWYVMPESNKFQTIVNVSEE